MPICLPCVTRQRPDVCATGRPVPTSGITQPAVAGFSLRRLFERSTDRLRAVERARNLLPAITAWHRWFHATRDPAGEDLVAIIHPWESGRDNSIDWDDAFAHVPTDGIAPYTRRDTQHAATAHRPTKVHYDRDLWLVEHFRALDRDNTKLHDASPFQIFDPGFNAILIRSAAEFAELAETLGEPALAAENRADAARGTAAMESLWSDEYGQYLSRDRITGALVESRSVGGLVAAFAPIPTDRAVRIADTIESHGTRFRVPSHAPDDPRFQEKRYWRGPVWLVVNYMIGDGLAEAGLDGPARAITQSSLDLIRASGFAEYYDLHSGESLGGERLTWTAAMVLEFLAFSE